MHPATESAMSPYAKKPKAGMPQIIGGTNLPVYDDGGLVDTVKQAGKDLWNKIVPDTSTLSHEQDDASKGIQENMKQAQYIHDLNNPTPESKTVVPSSTKDLINPAARYGSRPGEKRLSVYDQGGDVDVNVHDGRHQLAILQDGERVLTPQQNQGLKKFAKENDVKGFPKIYDDGGDVNAEDMKRASLADSDPVPEEAQAKMPQIAPAPAEQSHGVMRSDENAPASLIPEEKENPSQGHNLGQEWLKRMNVSAPESSTSDVNKSGGLAVGMPRVQDTYQAKAGSALIPEGETPSEARDFRNMDRKAQVQQLEQQRQAALKAGDLESADKLQVAAAQLSKTPWSDRSGLSKFGKIASTFGNIAGDIVSPSVMQLIPGTDANKAMRTQGAFNRIAPESEVNARDAATNAKEGKADNYDVKEVVDNRQGSPTFGQTIYAGVNKTDPTDVRYSPLQVAPKAAGEPKAETREQHLNRYAELKNQAESGAQLSDQDQKELNTLRTELTVPKATMDSYNKQIDAALHSAKVPQDLWNNYHVQPGATAEEAKQSIADAKSFSGETYQQGAEGRTMDKEERQQERKDKGTVVYAEDENGQLIKTNKADADKRGLVSEEMKSGDISKDRSAMRQLNDVQTNVNRYEKVIKEDLPKVSEEDRQLMTTIMTIDKESAGGMLTADVNGKGISIGGAVFPQLSAEVASRRLDLARADLAKLSPEAQRVMNAYLRTASSVPTYLKAIAGIGRSNKETLNLELANVPMPYFDQATVNGRMSAFQDNVDQARSGFPNNLPGMKLIESEREKNSIKAPAPADVEKSGTLNGQPVYQLKSGKTVYADGKPVEVK